MTTQPSLLSTPPLRALYLPLLLLPLALLQGCPAPILLAGAAGGVMVATDERTPERILDDNLIESRVRDKFHASLKQGEEAHVSVTCYNGVVLLTGETLTSERRLQVQEIARSEEKVRRVHNEIRVADLADLQSRSNDTLITSKVKSQLFTSKIDGSKIKVVTELGTVYLMGLVNRETGTQAAEIARNVSGVKRVVLLFEYY